MPNRTEMFPQPLSVKTETPFPSMVIPFTTGTGVSTTYSPAQSSASTVNMTSFGTSGTYNVGYDFNNNGYIGLSSSAAYDFRVSTDVSMVDIFAEAFYTSIISNTNGISPYVALAICDGSGDAFTIIPETMTIIDTRTSFTANVIYYNSKTAVPVNIPSGTRVAVVCGHTNGSTSTNSTVSFYFSGGVALW